VIEMPPLTGSNVVVIGGSRGVGRRVVEACLCEGARVLAVARGKAALGLVAEETGAEVLALDATEEGAPSKVFRVLEPDLLVLAAGACPPSRPLHDQSWQDFAVNWEIDVKIAFRFCKESLRRPLPRGTSVILIASSAALSGSPLTGGYAGAKRMQMWIANYSQKESDRLGLGMQFAVLAPYLIPGVGIGKQMVAGFAQYLGMSAADFVGAMAAPPTSAAVASAVIDLAAHPEQSKGRVFLVTGTGLETACLW
jgi:NAD(P)-dependent dehydrogenase (short-subunit alcohol dehydrogenase family)